MPATLSANRRAIQPGKLGTVASAFFSLGVGIRLESHRPGCLCAFRCYSGIMSAQSPQFDSHRFVKRLTNAGVSEEVAEILAEEHASLIPPADVATGSEITGVRGEVTGVRGEVAEVRAEVTGVRGEVAEVRAEVAEVRAEVAEVRAEVAATRATIVAEFKEALADFKTSTLKWMFGMMLAYTGFIFAAMAGFR